MRGWGKKVRRLVNRVTGEPDGQPPAQQPIQPEDEPQAPPAAPPAAPRRDPPPSSLQAPTVPTSSNTPSTSTGNVASANTCTPIAMSVATCGSCDDSTWAAILRKRPHYSMLNSVEEIENYIVEKMNERIDDDKAYPDEEECEHCGDRRARFVLDCSESHRLCTYCCFFVLYCSVQASRDGYVVSECPCCYGSVRTMTRTRRRYQHRNFWLSSSQPSTSQPSTSQYSSGISGSLSSGSQPSTSQPSTSSQPSSSLHGLSTNGQVAVGEESFSVANYMMQLIERGEFNEAFQSDSEPGPSSIPGSSSQPGTSSEFRASSGPGPSSVPRSSSGHGSSSRPGPSSEAGSSSGHGSSYGSGSSSGPGHSSRSGQSRGHGSSSRHK